MVDRLIRLLISLMVGAGDAVARFFFGSRLPGTCVVINYHAVPDEARACFAEQLDLVQRLTRPIPAAREAALERGLRYVAITADDLFTSFVKNGLPELSQRKIPVTLFVPTGYLGRNSSWNDYGGKNLVGERVASAEQLKQIAKSDTVDFGSHSVMHSDLALLPEAGTAQEMRESKAALETLVGREVSGLSFPYGSYGARELRLASETGYKFCFGSTPESVISGMRGGIIGRVSVQPTDWKLEFRLKILGAYRWVRWASNAKKRLRGH
jgi:peptidoglycan/xylan/chitin deacetylase (PgdA/CDA1 family)